MKHPQDDAPVVSSYGSHCVLPPQPFAQGFSLVTEGHGTEGFDVQATMTTKLGIEGRPHRTPGACNPPLAHRAPEVEPDSGLLLPCNVVVREEADGRLVAGFMDPVTVLQMAGDPKVGRVAHEGRQRLERVRAAVGGSAC